VGVRAVLDHEARCLVRARWMARRAEACRQLRQAADGWAEVVLVGMLAAGPSTRVRTVLVLGTGVAS
jgi:hypothetical protein